MSDNGEQIEYPPVKINDYIYTRNLTSPAPTDGILRYGDDIIVEFNEDPAMWATRTSSSPPSSTTSQ